MRLWVEPDSHSPVLWLGALDDVDRTGKCKIDLDGLVAVIAEVHRRYRGEERVYLSGFSAGAQTMWAMVFQHPEMLEAAAPTCGNFGGRCITEEEAFSKAQAKASLPIKGFEGENDHGREVLGAQFQLAKSLAEKRGYKNISYQIVPGRA